MLVMAFKSLLPAYLACTLLCSITPAVLAARRIVLHDSTGSLVTARIDPISGHNIISSHSHHVVGGSNFNSVYDHVKLRQSKCSNLGVHADMSNYWQPQLVQRLTNGSCIAMRTETRIYYEQPNTLKDRKVEPFPERFAMIAGDATRKTFNGRDQGHILQTFYCEIRNANGSIKSQKETHAMPTEPCDIIATKTWFPTCWNGLPYDRANPRAHVQYPVFGAGFLGPNCPQGFERRLISIQMETFYFRNKNVPAPAAGKPQFILSNGDTTGYGLHADFQNGWDTKVLQAMISDCKTVPVEEPPEKACAALKPSANRAKGDSCMYENKVPNEEVGYNYALRYLPGCNLEWSSGAKPTCNAKIFKGDPGWKKPAAGTVWP